MLKINIYRGCRYPYDTDLFNIINCEINLYL